MKASNKKSGYSLVEMLLYVAILSVVSIIVINTIFSFAGSYRNLTVLRAVEHSGIDAMERMTRDVRGASTVNTANSTLGSNPGVLTLVATANGVSTTTKFYLQNSIIKVDVNGVYYGPLTLSSTTVSSLIFTYMQSAVSSAVKIDMTVSETNAGITKTKNYHSTVVLKGL